MKSSDKILVEKLKKILIQKFPNTINNIIIYGSRGVQNKTDADLDLAVITNFKFGWREQHLIKEVIINFGIDNDIVFDPKIFSLQEFNIENSRFAFRNKLKNFGISI